MTTKRARLFAAAMPQPQEEAAPPAAAPEALQASPRPDRQGKRLIGGYFPLPAAQQLKMLSAERNRTNQELVQEAVNDLFQKYGKSRIA
jgi:hypothetical protein